LINLNIFDATFRNWVEIARIASCLASRLIGGHVYVNK